MPRSSKTDICRNLQLFFTLESENFGLCYRVTDVKMWILGSLMPPFKSGQKTLCQTVHGSFSAEVSQKLNLKWLAILLKDGTLGMASGIGQEEEGSLATWMFSRIALGASACSGHMAPAASAALWQGLFLHCVCYSHWVLIQTRQ